MRQEGPQPGLLRPQFLPSSDPLPPPTPADPLGPYSSADPRPPPCRPRPYSCRPSPTPADPLLNPADPHPCRHPSPPTPCRPPPPILQIPTPADFLPHSCRAPRPPLLQTPPASHSVPLQAGMWTGAVSPCAAAVFNLKFKHRHTGKKLHAWRNTAPTGMGAPPCRPWAALPGRFQRRAQLRGLRPREVLCNRLETRHLYMSA